MSDDDSLGTVFDRIASNQLLQVTGECFSMFVCGHFQKGIPAEDGEVFRTLEDILDAVTMWRDTA